MRWVVRRFALARGFIDPFHLMGRMQHFAQPSEVAWPIELVRAGVVFHARGLLNTRTIQHNLDWIWPYWIEQQFDPRSPSFIPRAFSATHINMTHRNWTAVGQPDGAHLPIVDPRGLLTPLYDGWSLDAWIVRPGRDWLIPSRCDRTDQSQFSTPHELGVETVCRLDGARLDTAAGMSDEDSPNRLHWSVEAESDSDAWLALSLRPVNPEGVSFVESVRYDPPNTLWRVNGRDIIRLDTAAERHLASDYHGGDVAEQLPEGPHTDRMECKAGMVTAALLYPLSPGRARRIQVDIDLSAESADEQPQACRTPEIRGWDRSLEGSAVLDVPDERYQHLYDSAIRSLVLHTPGETYPGPYTYKRFWFRDAAAIVYAQLAAGLTDRAWRVLQNYPHRQHMSGFFHSQDGEWDSNGAALWAMGQACRLTGRPAPDPWLPAIRKGVRWIARKRLPDTLEAPHAGLLPAGFSAEHLGPNDYYYWDDFWSVAGLREAARMLKTAGDTAAASEAETEAEALRAAIDRSLRLAQDRLGRPAMPAAPARRYDAGAIGSVCAGYPLQLFAGDDPRLLDLADVLQTRHFQHGGFFQDMIHSGINAYLTLHIAQVLLRSGDVRALDLIRTVADLASSTGQWPEAIHPATFGGCMGDGQHIWAAAEWVLMMRALFVREEEDGLVIVPGIPQDWLDPPAPVSFGPTPTRWGPCSIRVDKSAEGPVVTWSLAPRAAMPAVRIRCPGHAPADIEDTPEGSHPLVAL